MNVFKAYWLHLQLTRYLTQGMRKGIKFPVMEERHQAYSVALRVCKGHLNRQHYNVGLCYAMLAYKLGIGPVEFRIKAFPELFCQKPKHNVILYGFELYWFQLTEQGLKKRIKLLENA